jgi:NADH dehydrogenase
MATIGRNAAVAETGSVKARGFIAWLMWLFIHLLFLVGFRNRFFVLMQWFWSYFTWQRGARIILRK